MRARKIIWWTFLGIPIFGAIGLIAFFFYTLMHMPGRARERMR